jgi:hypothetical protein
MNASEASKRRWFELSLFPLKLFVLLALPLVFFADSPRMPWLAALDMSLDMLVGWLCLLCSVVFVSASVVQKYFGPEGAARRSIWFAVLAFILGAILSPLFAIG